MNCLARTLFVVLQIATAAMAADLPVDETTPRSIWTRLTQTREGEPRFQNHGYIAGEASRFALSETFLNADRTLYRPPLDTQLTRVVDDVSGVLPAAVNIKGSFAAEWDHDNSASVVRGQVRELYVTRSVGNFNLFLGRRILKWTNGYAFSPAGLIDPIRDPADPSDRLGRLGGRDLAQVDWFRGKQTVTAVLTFPFRTQSDGGDRVFALRYNVLLHGADIAASAAVASKSKSRGALSVSYVVGQSLELHGEASAARGSNVVYPRAILDGQQRTLFGTDYFSPVFENDRKVRLRALAGANFTFPGGLNLVAEYYHTDEGLTGQQWDNFLAQSSYASQLNQDGQFPPVRGGYTLPQLNLLQGLSYLRSQEIRRDYGFVRLARSFAGEKVAADILAVINLGDRSLLVAPEVSIKIGERTSLYARAVVFSGDSRSQYANVAFARTATAGLRVHY